VSAALAIPTIPLWYLRLLPWYHDWNWGLSGIWAIVLTLVLDIYLVVMAAIFARNSRRRVAASVVATVATVLDAGDTAIQAFGSTSDLLTWTDRVLTAIVFVLFVSAWGISRRRHAWWVIGLVPTSLIGIGLVALYASDWLYDTFTDIWFVYWVLWIGGFLLCTVICWGIDALASATSAKPVVDPADRLAG
jgi:hypothetical protein